MGVLSCLAPAAARTAALLLHAGDDGGCLGGWVCYGCMRLDMPDQLRDGPGWSRHKRNHLGESCCFLS